MSTTVPVSAVLEDGTKLEIRLVLDVTKRAEQVRVSARGAEPPQPPSLVPDFLLSAAAATQVSAEPQLAPRMAELRPQSPAAPVRATASVTHAAPPSAAVDHELARVQRQLEEMRRALSERDRQIDELVVAAPAPQASEFDATNLFQRPKPTWHDRPGAILGVVGAALVAAYFSFAVLGPALLRSATQPAPVVRTVAPAPGQVAAR